MNKAIQLEIDGQRISDCKDVEIRLAQSPTKARMIVFWVRDTDGKKCRRSAKDSIKILE
jgi:hypothetical protein